MRLPVFKPGLTAADTRRVAPPPKQSAPIYQSADYREWREAVISRAGRRCEIIVNGTRCWKSEPRHRMFADHRVEIKDGGAPFDPGNGQCLCGSHHTAKTAAERAKRRI
jgi:hypothetical protein